MSSADQTGLQQRTGYSTDQSGGEYVNNEKGFGGQPPQAQGNYAQAQGNYAQAQGNYPPQGYPVQQSYGPRTDGQYQGQAYPVGPDEYVDKNGHVVKRKTRGRKFAACLALCWCCTWPCHGPCCGGL